MKKQKDLNYENRVFCIRENNRWVAGIYNSGLPTSNDKKIEIALMKLSDMLYDLIEKMR